jgi:septum site-determining protein MinD
MGGDVGLALVVAEACVLVTTPQPAALSDAVRARALARELDTGLAQVVLNRAGERPPTERVARRLGAPVTTVPDSDALAAAQADGVPVGLTAPESEAAAAFEGVADAVRTTVSQ